MKTFISKFGPFMFALCCIVVFSAFLLLCCGGSYHLGKSSVTSQNVQTNNEFTIKMQQLQIEVLNKQEENRVLKTQVEILTTERDNAIEFGELSQEEIDNLNTQINSLNSTIEQNNDVISTLNGKVSKFGSIIDKTVTEITAEDLNGITTIGEYAFYSCQKLTSVELPESITKISASAFRTCQKLVNVDFSKCVNLTSIGKQAFYYCTSLQEIDLSGLTQLTVIDDSTFQTCTNLTTISFSTSITTIGNNVFQGCNKLTTLTVLAEEPPTLTSAIYVPDDCAIHIPDGSLDAYQNATYWSSHSDKFIEI